MRIELSGSELAIAGQAGLMRRISSLQKKFTDQVPTPHPWQVDIEGACAELACAKALGVFWSAGVNTFKASDLGRNVQVRHADKPDHRLIVRERDAAEDVYVLVVGLAPTYEMAGWILGSDAKNDKWIHDANGWGKPAWFIPRSALSSFESLKDVLIKVS